MVRGFLRNRATPLIVNRSPFPFPFSKRNKSSSRLTVDGTRVENFIDSTLITAIIAISGKFHHRRLRRVVHFHVVSREQFARLLTING